MEVRLQYHFQPELLTQIRLPRLPLTTFHNQKLPYRSITAAAHKQVESSASILMMPRSVPSGLAGGQKKHLLGLIDDQTKLQRQLQGITESGRRAALPL